MTTLPDFIESNRLNYDGKDYEVLNLKPGSIPDDDLPNRIYRSAILSPENQQFLCVAPSKSVPTLRETASSLEVTEIVEGTMINLFWNGEKWEIATKKRVGADNFYFKNTYGVEGELPKKSFRQMFLEALDVPDLSSIDFDRSFCYSFVLQHPCNHIVLNIITPQLYLVSTYKLSGMTCDYLSPRAHPDYDKIAARNIKVPRNFVFGSKSLSEDSFVSHPNRFTFEVVQKENLETIVANPENSDRILGLMVVDLLTGLLRTKFLNPKYLEMKQLRGNNPNLQYHYLQLRKSKKVDEFLAHFPMYAKHFEHFLEQFKTFGKRVRSVYWEVFVKKTKPFEELKYRDKFFVQKLHFEVFLPQHRENKKFFITDEIVEEFLDRDDVMVPI
jgi:hypothetical protein